jgi:HK97 family phage major capsid protein
MEQEAGAPHRPDVERRQDRRRAVRRQRQLHQAGRRPPRHRAHGLQVPRPERRRGQHHQPTTGTGGAGDGIAPDRLAGIITPPERVMTVRSLLMPGRTASNLIQFVQETGFQNMAAPVAEGAAKPQSDLTLELVDTPVRTIAHWFKASNQVLADIPLLQSYIDGRARYGLKYEEERSCSPATAPARTCWA